MKTVKYNDTDEYQHMTLLGTQGIYTPKRIEDKTMPEGFHHYQLTSGRLHRFGAVTEKAGRHDHAGDFISKTALDLGSSGRQKLRKDDWSIDSDKPFDFKEFWGKQLSIDKQISIADHKRMAQMGMDPNIARSDPQAATPEAEPMILN